MKITIWIKSHCLFHLYQHDNWLESSLNIPFFHFSFFSMLESASDQSDFSFLNTKSVASHAIGFLILEHKISGLNIYVSDTCLQCLDNCRFDQGPQKLIWAFSKRFSWLFSSEFLQEMFCFDKDRTKIDLSLFQELWLVYGIFCGQSQRRRAGT